MVKIVLTVVDVTLWVVVAVLQLLILWSIRRWNRRVDMLERLIVGRQVTVAPGAPPAQQSYRMGVAPPGNTPPDVHPMSPEIPIQSRKLKL